ncbi:MAG: phytanoyl-CoA dioxygenase family protein [Anaerolineaceae bacterium]|nr:phytanoyl-CoA dioxygenase family protein [Anaerolineaceae bacterium]
MDRLSVDLADRRRQLDDDGFCLLEGIIDERMLARMREVTDEVLTQTDTVHFDAKRSQGSVIPAFEHPGMAELVVHPPLLAALNGLGYADPKWGSGFIISKPPHSPPLFWHQDGRFWDEPACYTPQTIQCFLMIYLVDTTPHNGCLRVIPGSHVKRHALHDKLDEAHDDALGKMEDPQHLAFQRAAGEVDVPVRAGDVVMGSAQLLHAAHGNQSARRRTNITLWYYPAYAAMPESIQAFVAQEGWPDDWVQANRDRLEPLRPVYAGPARAIRHNRNPGAALK